MFFALSLSLLILGCAGTNPSQNTNKESQQEAQSKSPEALNSSGLGPQTPEMQSQAYWKAASPFAITQFTASGTNLTLLVQNNNAEAVALVSLRGIGFNPFASTTFLPGETKQINIQLRAPCPTGTAYSYDEIVITYIIRNDITRAFVGQKPLAGLCR